MPELLTPAVPSLVKLHFTAAELGMSLDQALIDFCEQRSRMTLKPARQCLLELMQHGSRTLPGLLNRINSSSIPDRIKKANAIVLSSVAELLLPEDAQYHRGPITQYAVSSDTQLRASLDLIRVHNKDPRLIYGYLWKTRLPEDYLGALKFMLKHALSYSADFRSLELDIYDASAGGSKLREPRILVSESICDGRELAQEIVAEYLAARERLKLIGYAPVVRRPKTNQDDPESRLF